MRECDNIKIHISSNFLLSIYLIIMLDIDKMWRFNMKAASSCYNHCPLMII